MPELRLWLGLWLEAQGKRTQAHTVAAPAIDARYGLAHCQPALRALLERVGPSIVKGTQARGARTATSK